MVSITCNSFEDWRNAAKRLLILRIPPHQTNWLLEAQQPLFPTLEKFLSQKNFKTSDSPRFLLPKRFLDLAQKVAAHTAPERWITLYSLAWRLIIEGETHLLQKTSDLDVRKATLWAKAVGREIHKMHAFLRFRSLGINSDTKREQFVAWFEPQFNILRLAAPFFVQRFSSMEWAILTPKECAIWDGNCLKFTTSSSIFSSTTTDDFEQAWQVYYRSIFNPARVNCSAMLKEMPRKFWKNLPEASVISDLLLNPTESTKQKRTLTKKIT